MLAQGLGITTWAADKVSRVTESETSDHSDQNAEPVTRGIGDRTAIALAFGSSAAVLVLELVSLRLVAPYLGLTLETNTAIIGVALAAIATGAAMGGRFADAGVPDPVARSVDAGVRRPGDADPAGRPLDR